jgi:tyrosine decarboxylase/aspartate 1-decarboxylase
MPTPRQPGASPGDPIHSHPHPLASNAHDCATLPATAEDPLPQLLAEALPRLYAAFPPIQPPAAPADAAGIPAILDQVATRLADNYLYFHPLYAGQMLKPPHLVARAAYALAMVLNPNNHALDGGRASSAMELEAVRAIAGIFGWQEYLGHLTSGGTFANLEALWVAGQIAGQIAGQTAKSAGPGSRKRILASSQAHYTHQRISAVLGLDFTSVPTDPRGRMDLAALAAELDRGDAGTVVVTLGTTATGAVDPLDAILPLCARHGVRVHVDAAYGGYFALAGNLAPEARRAFDALERADSIVIDPHKHGLQPYGCGCVLFRDPAVGRFYKHDSPYTYFTSTDLHLGEISLECSRAGAAAVALWATQQLLPMTPGGDFAHGLEHCRSAALDFHARLERDPRFVPAFAPELDIVVWAVKATDCSRSSALAQRTFALAAERDLHLALVRLPTRFFPPETWRDAPADGEVLCLRSVLMKPEHQSWLPEIYSRLGEAVEIALRTT